MKAPLYRSETRSILIGDIPPVLRIALLQYAEKHKLKLVGASAWLTSRENPKSTTMVGKLFGRRSNQADPDASHEMLLVVHATHLLVATSGAVRGTSVLSLPLLAATLTRGSLLPGGETPSDDGLTITGFPGDQGAATYFMGLGAGPDADSCVSAAMAAVDAAKNPTA